MKNINSNLLQLKRKNLLERIEFVTILVKKLVTNEGKLFGVFFFTFFWI